jgi:hypothetical protein
MRAREPGDISGAPPPPAATGIEQFFHGTTWRIAQQLPGNVQFYTHHDAVPARAEQRARDWGCRLSMNMKQPERYAGVIRFDVKQSDYYRLFTNRKYFGLVSTKQPDYGAKRREWLDFVSGPGRGREASPSFDPAAGAWRHEAQRAALADVDCRGPACDRSRATWTDRRAITLDRLKMRIDEIAWHEQVDRELSESKAPAYEFSPTRIETELRGLGSGLAHVCGFCGCSCS